MARAETRDQRERALAVASALNLESSLPAPTAKARADRGRKRVVERALASDLRSQSSHLGRTIDAVYLVRCPVCAARIGERCKGGKDTHKRRIARAAKT